MAERGADLASESWAICDDGGYGLRERDAFAELKVASQTSRGALEGVHDLAVSWGSGGDVEVDDKGLDLAVDVARYGGQHSMASTTPTWAQVLAAAQPAMTPALGSTPPLTALPNERNRGRRLARIVVRASATGMPRRAAYSMARGCWRCS